MLLTAVIIVLKEVLEAALLVSTLISLTQYFKQTNRWFFFAFLIGMIGAILYVIFINPITESFSGMGQEIVNAALEFSICILFFILSVGIKQHIMNNTFPRHLLIFVTGIVSLTLTRENFEIIIYLMGFWDDKVKLFSVILGSMLGAGIGISIGIIIYYMIHSIRQQAIIASVYIFLIALITAGLFGGAILLLMQADWIPSQPPLWDTSHLLSEESLIGELFYALTDYEATPSFYHVLGYSLAFFLVIILSMIPQPKKHAI